MRTQYRHNYNLYCQYIPPNIKVFLENTKDSQPMCTILSENELVPVSQIKLQNNLQLEQNQIGWPYIY